MLACNTKKGEALSGFAFFVVPLGLEPRTY